MAGAGRGVGAAGATHRAGPRGTAAAAGEAAAGEARGGPTTAGGGPTTAGEPEAPATPARATGAIHQTTAAPARSSPPRPPRLRCCAAASTAAARCTDGPSTRPLTARRRSWRACRAWVWTSPASLASPRGRRWPSGVSRGTAPGPPFGWATATAAARPVSPLAPGPKPPTTPRSRCSSTVKGPTSRPPRGWSTR